MKKESKTFKDLVALGFSLNRAAVYASLLELGRGTVSEIARKAGINRTTGYDILDNLVADGLASVSGKEPKQEYVAETPEKIRNLLEQKMETDKAALKSFENFLPELKSLHNVAGRPRIRFYEGKEGLIDVYEDTLTAREPIRAYATVDDMHNALPDYFPRYYERRAEKGIAIRAIIPATETGTERARLDKEELRETALIPPNKYYFSPEINIYDDKVMIASWREKLGIIIQSAEIADAIKKIYELAWAEAKRLGVENPQQK